MDPKELAALSRKDLVALFSKKQDAIKALAAKGADNMTGDDDVALEGLIVERDALKAEIERRGDPAAVKARVSAGPAVEGSTSEVQTTVGRSTCKAKTLSMATRASGGRFRFIQSTPS